MCLVRTATLAIVLVGFVVSGAPPSRLSTAEDYRKYIDPLVTMDDAGVMYNDDGAADASVLFPGSGRPRDPVIALVRLRAKSLPLLIDCLSDTRVSKAGFGGDATTRPMKVPVGYVCLDLLMGTAKNRAIFRPDCADDGLGACVSTGYYFRPDDYFHCIEGDCDARPWVAVVQRNWRQLFLSGRLRFHNPYDSAYADEYKEFSTRGK